MQSAAARVAADNEGVAGAAVNRQVVGTAEAVVVRSLREGDRRSADPAELAQVEDLHAMVGVLGDGVRVRAADLDVPPVLAAEVGVRRQLPDHVGTPRLADVDKGGPFDAADDRVVPAGLAVRPSPHVVREAEPEPVQGNAAEHVDPPARERVGGHPLDAAREPGAAPGGTLRGRLEGLREVRPLLRQRRLSSFVIRTVCLRDPDPRDACREERCGRCGHSKSHPTVPLVRRDVPAMRCRTPAVCEPSRAVGV